MAHLHCTLDKIDLGLFPEKSFYEVFGRIKFHKEISIFFFLYPSAVLKKLDRYGNNFL